MPRKIQIPDGLKQLLALIYPERDLERVAFYEGMPFYMRGRRKAVALGPRVYFQKRFDPCSCDGAGLIVHALYSLRQGAAGWGFWFYRPFFVRYVWEWIRRGFRAGREHPLEWPAYEVQRMVQECWQRVADSTGQAGPCVYEDDMPAGVNQAFLDGFAAEYAWRRTREDEGEKLRLILDRPTAEGVFRFPEFAAALVSAIRQSDPQFTIGIFGDWGTGKTTLLRMIEKELHGDPAVATVWFNAWRYQHMEHLAVPLLESIRVSLENQQGKGWFFQKVAGQMGKVLYSLAYGLTAQPFGIGVSAKDVLDKLQQGKSSPPSDDPLFLSIQTLEAFEDEVGKARTGDAAERVVVLIDDLDRCTPLKVLEVLEAIKVLLDLEGFVFALALDRSVVQQGIDAKFGKNSGIDASRYIKKIVQVPFQIPERRPEDVQKFAEGLQQQVAQALDNDLTKALLAMVPVVAEGNPREAKRFINDFLLTMQITHNVGAQVAVEPLLMLMAIRFRWEGFRRRIARRRKRQELLNNLKQFLREELAEESEERKDIVTLLQANTGLEEFLRRPEIADFTNALLDADAKTLETLLSYTGVTGAEVQPLTPEEAVLAVREGRSLAGVDLSYILLMAADLRRADLSRANLSDADLSDADLSRANLQDANLSWADLSRASLREADLSGADLSRANLQDADLSYADLSRANLRDADLRGVQVDAEHIDLSNTLYWWEAKWDPDAMKVLERRFVRRE